MAISIDHLSQVLAELKPALRGGKIQKITQPFTDSLTLEIRRPGQTTTLFISTHSQTARLHALTQRLPNLSTPPSFCQYLRSHILGAHIVNIFQVPNDRVIICNLLVKQEEYNLVAALTGRSANIILANQHYNVVRTLKPDKQASQRIQQYFSFLEEQANAATKMQTQIESHPQAFPNSTMLEQAYLELQKEQAKHHQKEQQLYQHFERLEQYQMNLLQSTLQIKNHH